MLCALPEQPPEEHPTSTRRINVVLLAVLLALLLLALVLVFPILISSPGQRLISHNWAGYSVASDLNNPKPLVTSINASWTVPTVSVSIGYSYCATWIGVGGQFDDTLIQAGTEQDSINGQATYSAWYELLPQGVVTIHSFSVFPGDRITASISLLNSTTSRWSIEIYDVTNGQSFQKSLVYDSSMLSAEWIVERPSVNTRVGNLADFGEITFTGCTATIDGKVGTISNFPFIQATMYNSQNIELTTVSHLTPDGSSFTVYYVG